MGCLPLVALCCMRWRRAGGSGRAQCSRRHGAEQRWLPTYCRCCVLGSRVVHAAATRSQRKTGGNRAWRDPEARNEQCCTRVQLPAPVQLMALSHLSVVQLQRARGVSRHFNRWGFLENTAPLRVNESFGLVEPQRSMSGIVCRPRGKHGLPNMGCQMWAKYGLPFSTMALITPGPFIIIY